MFGPRFGGPGLYYSGSPFGSITGAVTYDASLDLWTVTGNAYLTIDPDTLIAPLMCRRLVVDGGLLTVNAACKGMYLWPKSYELKNGGGISMTGKGCGGTVASDLNIHDLLPRALKARLSRSLLAAYALKALGAAGGAARVGGGVGNAGAAATAWQSGGGGSGSVLNSGTGGKGGRGGPFHGGGGGGGITNSGATHYGTAPIDATDAGAGGDGYTSPGDMCAGGAGIPPGVGNNTGGATDDGGNGAAAPLIIFAPSHLIAAGCVIQSDGLVGGSSAHNCGGSNGGGIVGLIWRDTYTNNGTVRANGGAAAVGGVNGGPGGAGSVNVAQHA